MMSKKVKVVYKHLYTTFKFLFKNSKILGAVQQHFVWTTTFPGYVQPREYLEVKLCR